MESQMKIVKQVTFASQTVELAPQTEKVLNISEPTAHELQKQIDARKEKLEIRKANIFYAPRHYALAHCVSADFAMSAGIAVAFKSKYPILKRLPLTKVGGVATVRSGDRVIFNLVTKKYKGDKPTLDSIKKSLISMREKCSAFKVKQIAMPKIGCGLDGQDWTKVSEVIHDVFNSSGIEIVIFEYDGTRHKVAPKQHIKSDVKITKTFPKGLTEVPKQVAPVSTTNEVKSDTLGKVKHSNFDVYRQFGYRINHNYINDDNRSMYKARRFLPYMRQEAENKNSSIKAMENFLFVPTELITITNWKNQHYHVDNIERYTKEKLSFFMSKNITTFKNVLDLSALQATLYCMFYLKGSRDVIYNMSYFLVCFETCVAVNSKLYKVDVTEQQIETYKRHADFVVPLDVPTQFKSYTNKLSMPVADDYLPEFEEKWQFLDNAYMRMLCNPWEFLGSSLGEREKKWLNELSEHKEEENIEILADITKRGIFWFVQATDKFVKFDFQKSKRITWRRIGTKMAAPISLDNALEWYRETLSAEIQAWYGEKYGKTGLYKMVSNTVEKYAQTGQMFDTFQRRISLETRYSTAKIFAAMQNFSYVGLNKDFFKERRDLFMANRSEEYVQELWEDLCSTDSIMRFNNRLCKDSQFYSYMRYEVAKRSMVNTIIETVTGGERSFPIEVFSLEGFVLNYIDQIKQMLPTVGTIDAFLQRIGKNVGQGLATAFEDSSSIFSEVAAQAATAATSAVTSDDRVREITDDINNLATLATGTPAGEIITHQREWLTEQVSCILKLISGALDSFINLTFKKILGLFGIPEVDMAKRISVPRIILAFVIYQRLKPHDYVAYLSLLTLMFNDVEPILDVMDIILKTIKYLWEVSKKVLKKVTHYDCKGCFICKIFKTSDGETVQPTSDEVSTQSLDEDANDLLTIENMLNKDIQGNVNLIAATNRVNEIETKINSDVVERLIVDVAPGEHDVGNQVRAMRLTCVRILNLIEKKKDVIPIKIATTGYDVQIEGRSSGEYKPPRSFASIIAGLDNEVQELENPPVTSTETPPVETEIKPEEIEPKGLACWLASLWAKADPKALGVLGTALALAIGVKASIRDLYKDAAKGILEMMKNFHWFACGSLAVAKIFTSLYGAIAWAFEKFREWKDPTYQTETQFFAEVEQWLNKAGMCEKGITEIAYLANPAIGIWYQAIKTQGFSIRAKMSKLTKHLQLKLAFEAAWRKVMSISNIMDSLMKFSCGRYEPFHVQITGEPGIGKTNVQAELVKELGPIIASNQHVYPINDKLEYLDNYCGQEIAVWDDTHMEREDEQYTTKILLLSGGSVILPMADLADKGKPIDFKLVLSNTNVPFPQFTNVAENKALWRRRILIEAVVNPVKFDNAEEITGTSNKYLQNLLFTVLKPTEETMQPLDRGLAGLVWKDLVLYLKTIAKKHDATETKRSKEQGTHDLREAMAQFKQTWTMILAENLPPDANQMRQMGRMYEEFAQEMQSVLDNPARHAAGDFFSTHILGLESQSSLSPTTDNEPITADEEIEWMRTFLGNLTPRFVYNQNTERFISAPHYQGETDNEYLTRMNMMNHEHPTFRYPDWDHGVYTVCPGQAGWGLLRPRTKIAMDLPVGELVVKKVTGFELPEGDTHCNWYALCKKENGDKSLSLPEDMPDPTIDGTHTTISARVTSSRQSGTVITNLYLRTDKEELTDVEKEHFYIVLMTLGAKNTFKTMRDEYEQYDMYDKHYQELKRIFWERQNPWRAYIKKIFKDLVKKGFYLSHISLCLISIIYVLYVVIYCMAIAEMFGKANNVDPAVYHHEGVKRLRTMQPTSAESYNFASQYTDIAMRHAYRVRVCGNVITNGRIRPVVRTCNFVGIKGNLFLTTKHTFTGLIDASYELEIFDNLNMFAGKPNFSWETATINAAKDIKEIPNRDAVVVYIPTFRSTKNGLHQFLTRDDLAADLLDGSTHRAVSFGESSGSIYLESIELRNFNIRYNENYSNEFGTYKNDKVYAFTMDAKAIPQGHSGSVVFHDNSLIQRGFVGIVGASDTRRTVVVPICQEDLKEACSHFDKIKQIVVEEIIGDNPTGYDKELYDITPVVGLYYPPQAGPSISKIVPSIFHKDVMDMCPYEPAIISDKDKRFNPELEHYAHIGINKFSYPQVFQDRDGIMHAAEELGKYHATLMPNVRFQTIYESVAGSGRLGSAPLDLNKGAGLPWSHMTPDKGKKGFINRDELTGHYNIHRLLIHNIKDILASCEECVYPAKTYQMFYKDELVKTSKIYESPKTRTIIMPALDVLIANGVLTGDICRNFKNMSVTQSRIASGFNFESLQFNEFINWLEYHKTMIGFDVKNWDGSCCLSWSEAIANYYYHLYKTAYTARGEPMPDKMREVLHTFTVGQAHTTIVHGKVIFVVKHGLKSGERDTLVKNSLGHLIMDYFFYKNIIREKKAHLANINSYLQHVRTVTCGDDVIRGINPAYSDILTPEAYVKQYNAMGFDVTTAHKDKNFRFETIDEISFLQLNARWDSENNIWVAKTSAKIFWNLLAWQRNTLPPKEQLIVNLYNACRAAYHRGRKEYIELTSNITILCAKHRILFSVPDYDSVGAWIRQDLSMAENGIDCVKVGVNLTV